MAKIYALPEKKLIGLSIQRFSSPHGRRTIVRVSVGVLVCKSILIMTRKDKPIGQSLEQSFSWNEALDSIADSYNGVSFPNILRSQLTRSSLCSGRCSHLFRSPFGVSGIPV